MKSYETWWNPVKFLQQETKYKIGRGAREWKGDVHSNEIKGSPVGATATVDATVSRRRDGVGFENVGAPIQFAARTSQAPGTFSTRNQIYLPTRRPNLHDLTFPRRLSFTPFFRHSIRKKTRNQKMQENEGKVPVLT